MDATHVRHFAEQLNMYVSVAVPRQDSMSPARAHAVLSGHCNRFVGLYRLIKFPST